MAATRLSILMAVYDMTREARRTLTSLTPAYQEGVSEGDYEVLVVENPSPSCLSQEEVESFGGNFRYSRASEPSLSPARILNEAAKRAKGSYLLLLIDGARLLSPGVLRNVFDAIRLHPRPLVAFHGFHLGTEVQNKAVANGYDKATEDRLLTSIGWPRNGYAVFGNSVFAMSSAAGWFCPMAESNCVALPKTSFMALGGFDERFATPGGGLVNLEFHERVLALPDHRLFHVLGEGTFHQVHGGASTNAKISIGQQFQDEYARLKGRRWRMPHSPDPHYLGSIKMPAVKKLDQSARHRHRQKQIREPQFIGRRLDELLDDSCPSINEGAFGRPIIFIHGMHRSGTSALAKGFVQLGGEVPPPMIGKSTSNPDGHFESHPVVMLNERILRTLGCSWHHLSALPQGWPARPAMAPFVKAARCLLADAGVLQTNGASDTPISPIVLKDPRFARVWPVWAEALKPMSGPVHHMVIIRSPAAVAQSLQRRDAMTTQHGLLLWARYTRELFDHLEGVPFGLVRYEAMASADGRREMAQALSASALDSFAGDQVARLHSAFRQGSTSEPATPAPFFQKIYEGLMRDNALAEIMAQIDKRLEVSPHFWGQYIRRLEQNDVI